MTSEKGDPSGEAPSDPAMVDQAVIAYVGYGRSRTPAADADAVLRLAPTGGSDLLATVTRIVRASDGVRIRREEFGNEDKSIRFSQEFERIWPGLGAEALRALSWRWAYNEFF
ncbi:hypothetical protein [Microbacterium xanthum]|uniref:hypothetical protein n=1 Tax=Microbacterium xanthum TaxID=3079794 RepID=UPI002AD3DF42|nr:hypothetical protein [Microbacterium sp. KSW-48]MDZ8171383.1 hypothetical protein [Microbacterium sp. KSW-48]